MGLLERLTGREGRDLNQRFMEIRNQTHERARRQSHELKIEITSEARRLGRACGIERKRDFRQYKDIVIMLLANYPPELANSIIREFDQFTPALGYLPFGRIYLAMEHLDELTGPLIADTNFLKRNPRVMEFMNRSPERTQKAAKTLAAATYSMVDMKDARETFHVLTNPQMIELVKRELMSVDERVGRYLTR